MTMNAKCKKFLTMLLLVCVSIGAAGCSAYSNQRYYERAQLMMGSGEYAEAAELFHQLGEYEDSAEYALYAAALDALQRGKIDLARANLMEIAPFKSADRYLRYLDALDAEKNRVPAHFYCTKKEKPLMQLPLILLTSAWILPRNRTA
jgi:tetratricopeptide (TPR) repeat protein